MKNKIIILITVGTYKTRTTDNRLGTKHGLGYKTRTGYKKYRLWYIKSGKKNIFVINCVQMQTEYKNIENRRLKLIPGNYLDRQSTLQSAQFKVSSLRWGTEIWYFVLDNVKSTFYTLVLIFYTQSVFYTLQSVFYTQSAVRVHFLDPSLCFIPSP